MHQILFIFHLKHDLNQSDSIVGLVLCLASVGSIFAGIVTPSLRRRLGFGAVWLGGMFLEGLSIVMIGPTITVSLIVLLTMGFTFSDTIMRVSWISLRQQVTPDHLLGRVTSTFLTLIAIPTSLGAIFTTLLAAKIGVPQTLIVVGIIAMLLAIIGCCTPASLTSSLQLKPEDSHSHR